MTLFARCGIAWCMTLHVIKAQQCRRVSTSETNSSHLTFLVGWKRVLATLESVCVFRQYRCPYLFVAAGLDLDLSQRFGLSHFFNVLVYVKVHRTRKEEEKRTESHYRYIPVTSSASRREDRSTVDFTRSAKTQ